MSMRDSDTSKLYREAIAPPPRRSAGGFLLAAAVLGGIGFGFGMGAISAHGGLPLLARVTPFDIGPGVGPSTTILPAQASNLAGSCKVWRTQSAKRGPRLGVVVRPLTSALRKSLSVPRDVERGAVIAQVVEGTAAASAGLASGDVIVRVGDVAIRGPAHLQETIWKAPAGVSVTVIRDGVRQSFSADLPAATPSAQGRSRS
jgi:membrane-associated protease RseP (regulator of RpoE activity)